MGLWNDGPFQLYLILGREKVTRALAGKCGDWRFITVFFYEQVMECKQVHYHGTVAKKSQEPCLMSMEAVTYSQCCFTKKQWSVSRCIIVLQKPKSHRGHVWRVWRLGNFHNVAVRKSNEVWAGAIIVLQKPKSHRGHVWRVWRLGHFHNVVLRKKQWSVSRCIIVLQKLKVTGAISDKCWDWGFITALFHEQVMKSEKVNYRGNVAKKSQKVWRKWRHHSTAI